jgi:hypothetical protein
MYMRTAGVEKREKEFIERARKGSEAGVKQK